MAGQRRERNGLAEGNNDIKKLSGWLQWLYERSALLAVPNREIPSARLPSRAAVGPYISTNCGFAKETCVLYYCSPKSISHSISWGRYILTKRMPLLLLTITIGCRSCFLLPPYPFD
jgi:hypothetical protein